MKFDLTLTFAIPVITLLLAPTSGCHDPAGPEAETSPEIISRGILPLKVGYYWQYDRFALNDSGTVAGKIGSIGFRVSNRSINPRPQGADTVFHHVYYDTRTGKNGYVEWLYRNFSEGLYAMGGVAPSDSLRITLPYLKYPARKGDTWTRPRIVFDLLSQRFTVQDSLLYACTDTSAQFVTPLGTFSCVVYNHMEPIEEIPGKQYDISEYYSRLMGKVGEIRQIYSDSTHRRYPIQKDVLVSTNVPTTN